MFVQLKTVSGLNAREHFQARARRVRAERNAGYLAAHALTRGNRPKPPLTITLTHVGRKRDSDNVPGSLKGFRDGVADYLKIDDGDERLTWLYAQRPGKQPGVDIEICATE